MRNLAGIIHGLFFRFSEKSNDPVYHQENAAHNFKQVLVVPFGEIRHFRIENVSNENVDDIRNQHTEIEGKSSPDPFADTCFQQNEKYRPDHDAQDKPGNYCFNDDFSHGLRVWTKIIFLVMFQSKIKRFWIFPADPRGLRRGFP
ncbi:MAG: hypothetical protein K0R65_1158 [Crocinitomicaceae bacterium]|nr:hypothetical protein [Crocinitomicaceae bacterium]